MSLSTPPTLSALALTLSLASWAVAPEAAAAEIGGGPPKGIQLAQSHGATSSGSSATVSWRSPRGFLGVHVVPLTEELRLHLGAPEAAGVLISRVTPGSPADSAGLAVGDVLVSIDGSPVTSAASLRRALGPRQEGEQVELEVHRDGRLRLLYATLAQRQPATLDLDLSGLFETDEAGRVGLFMGEEWEAFGRRMAELGEQIGVLGLAVGEEVGRRIAEELGPALERLMDPEVRLRLEEELQRWEQEGLPRLEESLREMERRLEERFQDWDSREP